MAVPRLIFQKMTCNPKLRPVCAHLAATHSVCTTLHAAGRWRESPTWRDGDFYNCYAAVSEDEYARLF